MNNATLQIKFKERLNKIASNDYPNLECWVIAEAFTKGALQWCRRNLRAENAKQEGDEGSISRIDDLQLLITDPLMFTGFVDKGIYFQTDISQWPKDYLRYKRIILTATNECCDKPTIFTVYLGEEGNVDIYLSDPNIAPDFPWRHTFATVTGNKLNIYHNNKFSIDTCGLIYYREPIKIQIANCRDVYTNTIPTVDIECEFPDNMVELFIEEGAQILAGDMENQFQVQRLNQDVEKNN